MKFIHLTDPHLVPAPRRLYALDPRERLRAAVADIARGHGDAAFAVITGDLVHFGEPSAYEELRRILADLPIPCHLAIGNHDERAAFRTAFPEVPCDEDGFVQYVAVGDEADLVVLDSVVPGSGGGALCERRLAWLEARLAERGGRALIVAVHHAPCDIGIPAMDRIKLAESARLAELLRRHGGVRHILFGHVHRAVSGSWRGIPFSTLPATAHQVALQFAEPELTPGSHEPPAYGVGLFDGMNLVMHQQAYLDDSARFILDDPAAAAAHDIDELTARAKAAG
ncbi:MAG TPA: phosphodiesterase [Kiloniellales bacterium]|nr:phosphodiesterase [Kiloniellales bacterium]